MSRLTRLTTAGTSCRSI